MYRGRMGPYAQNELHDDIPRAEDSGLAFLDAYSRRYGLTIKAARGDWTVEGGGLTEPVTVPSYTELVVYLARTFGWL
jgi:hypothetical protein